MPLVPLTNFMSAQANTLDPGTLQDKKHFFFKENGFLLIIKITNQQTDNMASLLLVLTLQRIQQ